MSPIKTRLRDAYAKSGMTMVDLLKLSGLDADRTTLRRKFFSDVRPTVLRIEEAELIARALGLKLVLVPRKRRANAVG